MVDPSCQKQIPSRTAGHLAVSSRPAGSDPCCCGRRRTALFPARRGVPGDKSISHRALMLGGAGGRREPDRGPARGRGRAAHRRGDARHGRRASSAAATAAGGSTGVGVGGLAEPADVARMRQCRHRRAAADGRCSPATAFTSLLHRRRLAALAADGAGDRAAGRDGRAFLARERRPAAAGADRPDRPAADRLRAAGRLGPGEVGGAAGGAARARGHDGDRAEAIARPHRADARGAWAPRSTVEAPRTAAGASPSRGQPELQPQRVRRAGRPVLGGFPLVAAAVAPGSEVGVAGVGAQPAAHRPLRPRCARWARTSWSRTSASDGGEPVGDLVVRGAAR